MGDPDPTSQQADAGSGKKRTTAQALRQLFSDSRSVVEFLAIMLAATALILESRSNQEANQLEGALLELEIVTDEEKQNRYHRSAGELFSRFKTKGFWRDEQKDLWIWMAPESRTISVADSADGRPDIAIPFADIGRLYNGMYRYAQLLSICGSAGRCADYFQYQGSYGCQVINDTLVAQRLYHSLRTLMQDGRLSPGERTKLTAKERDTLWWQLDDYALSRDYDALCGD